MGILMEAIMKKITSTNYSIINIALLSLIGIAFATFDWIVGLVTFSDYIIAFILVLLLVTRNIFIKEKDIHIAVLVLGLLSTNVVYHFFRSDITINPSVAALIRLSFYVITTLIFYNFIAANKLKSKLLLVINVVAMITIAIGIYITIILVLDLELPYEFLWTFTRSDSRSYLFRGANKVVRTRSIFAEPSHFGYFLNVILGINLFSKEKLKYVFWLNSIIILALISTLSYSALAITSTVLLAFFISLLIKDVRNLTDKKTLLGIGLFILALILFRDLINTTIITRTRDIYMGYDNSAIQRVVESWEYANRDSWGFGNGLGQTPYIFNNYAYMISDVGVAAFIGSILFTIYLMYKNFGLGLLFLMVNFQKGGYISPSFWLMLLLMTCSSGGIRKFDISIMLSSSILIIFGFTNTRFLKLVFKNNFLSFLMRYS